MLIKIPLLDGANSTTPGTPVHIGGNLDGVFAIRTCSGAYAAAGSIDLSFERAETENGPWEPTAVATHAITSDQAGVPATIVLGAVPVIWLRAKLSAAPSAGSVDVNLYIEV